MKLLATDGGEEKKKDADMCLVHDKSEDPAFAIARNDGKLRYDIPRVSWNSALAIMLLNAHRECSVCFDSTEGKSSRKVSAQGWK